MESCPTQAVLPLVGLAAEKVIRDRYIRLFMNEAIYERSKDPANGQTIIAYGYSTDCFQGNIPAFNRSPIRLLSPFVYPSLSRLSNDLQAQSVHVRDG
ncbi:MAG: hypothetical protein ACQESR_27365 [Planctomycetota bacterium]